MKLVELMPLVHLSPCGRGRIASQDAIRVRGLSPHIKLPIVPADATPHPARTKVRATFSHKGRRKNSRRAALTKVHHAVAMLDCGQVPQSCFSKNRSG